MKNLIRKIKYLPKFYSVIIILSTLSLGVSNNVVAAEDLISLFPLENYSQQISDWLKPQANDYDQELLGPALQQQHFKNLYAHYFGKSSPWNSEYIINILQQRSPNDLKSIEQSIIVFFTNDNKPENKIGYGANFRPYPSQWIKDISHNINLLQFENLRYDPKQRAIALKNIQARVLPTITPHFYNHRLAGQGYPFDNLQMSSVWVGTPLYILATTRDGMWSYVVTPDFITWVPRDDIAYISNANIDKWQHAAALDLGAIIKTKARLRAEVSTKQIVAYVGTLLPLVTQNNEVKLMLPVANANRHAEIVLATTDPQNIVRMPLTLTRHHIATVISTLLNRPYGWGNLYFYNDCSAELKNLFTPFGIYLARHSSEQVKVGNMVDKSSATPEQRLAFLMQQGKPFLNIVYIGGHVFWYLGNFPNPHLSGQLMAMTYQNLWGLSPNPPIRRVIVGQSLFFPLLLQYPEDTRLGSPLAAKYFQIAYLDAPIILPTAHPGLNLRALALPELMVAE